MQARGKECPPNGLCMIRPSSRRDHGTPQCSRSRISSGEVFTNRSTVSWSARKSAPFTVSQACSSRLSPSSGRITAAVPPSAHTECERMTCTFDTMPMSAVPRVLRQISTCGAQSGQSGSQDQDVMSNLVHASSPPRRFRFAARPIPSPPPETCHCIRFRREWKSASAGHAHNRSMALGAWAAPYPVHLWPKRWARSRKS